MFRAMITRRTTRRRINVAGNGRPSRQCGPSLGSIKSLLGSRRRYRTVVLTALLLSSCCIAGLILFYYRCCSGVYNLWYNDESLHNFPAKGTGEGILLFAYGMENETTMKYLTEAFVSARHIKALNPTANITLVTNPGLHPTIDGAFDLVINIEPKFLVPGKVSSWTPTGFPRQWLTRIEYLGRSPYEVTFALDAGVLCCSSRVDEVLKQGLREFDFAFAVQGPRVLAPHNWAIMYRLSDNTRRLLKRWRILQLALSKTGSDQGTLHLAAGSLALQDKLNVGVISEVVAMSLVPYNRTAPPWPKTSQLIAPGPVLFAHYKTYSYEETTTACNRLNEDTSRARVLFQRTYMPKYKDTKVVKNNTWEMKYSEAELAEAAKNANGEGVYFRGLDWNNMEGKWGHVVTPWRDLYPYCWDHLREEVKEGMQELMEKRNVRWSPVFKAEFANDDILK